MPFTLSHPAAVLPLRRLGLPVTALVLGSMVPDGPLFVGWVRGYELTHSLLGVVTVDVVATVLVLATWTFVVRDALVDLAPGAVRSRFSPQARLSAREWLLAPVAAVIGSATHLFWDSFTHGDRWGSDRVSWLREDHLGLIGFRWAQYVSGAVGLALVIGAAVAHLRRLPPDRPRPAAALAPRYLALAIAAPLAVGSVAAIGRVPDGLHAVAFTGVVTTLLVAGPSVLAVCLAWHAAARRRGVDRGARA